MHYIHVPLTVNLLLEVQIVCAFSVAIVQIIDTGHTHALVLSHIRKFLETSCLSPYMTFLSMTKVVVYTLA